MPSSVFCASVAVPSSAARHWYACSKHAPVPDVLREQLRLKSLQHLLHVNPADDNHRGSVNAFVGAIPRNAAAMPAPIKRKPWTPCL
jgi:hypothetical protein